MKKRTVCCVGLCSVLIWVVLILPLTAASAQTNRGMGVSPDTLPKALRDLAPKDVFVSSTQKKVGVIHALEGKVVVVHRTTKEAFFGMEGDAIFEKDALTTLADSRCRVRFLDDDVVTMAPETEFSVEDFQDQRVEGKKTSTFSMLKGKALFYAMRLFRYKESRFTLNTPTVTVGVRGTKFGAYVYYAGDERRADLGIRVADAGNEIAPYLAQAGGGQSFTDAFSEDGVLNVNGQPVGPGQMYQGATGQIIPTPPQVIQSFQQATGMGAQAGKQKTSEGGGGGPPGGTGDTGLQSLLDAFENATLVTQVTGGKQVEQETLQQPITPYPGPLYGYFALLLKQNPLYDVFLSQHYPGRTDEDINVYLYATDTSLHSSDFIYYSNPAGSGVDVGSAYLNGSSGSDVLDVDGAKNYIGQHSYTQWGYWQSNTPTTFTVGAYDYQFVNDRVWFVEGTHVTNATELAAMPTGDYAYSGAAHGTYYDSSGSAGLSGTFNCNVHIGSAYVKDFNLSTSGGGHTATFLQSGSATIHSGSSSNFFNITSGTAKIDGSEVSYKGVSGALYGPNGQEIGGNWGMLCPTTGKGAAGIFAGKK